MSGHGTLIDPSAVIGGRELCSFGTSSGVRCRYPVLPSSRVGLDGGCVTEGCVGHTHPHDDRSAETPQAKESAPNFSRRSVRRVRTVELLIPNSSAIADALLPWATR